MTVEVDNLIARTLCSDGIELLDAIHALSAHLDRPEAVDRLFVLLADADVNVREAAAAALNRRGRTGRHSGK